MRIRNRLLILVLSILIPAFIAAILAVAYVYVEQRKAHEKSVADATRVFGLLVDNELRHKEGILRTLANSPALESDDLDMFYRYAKSVAPSPETAVVLADLNGRQLMNTRIPLGGNPPARRHSNLAQLMERHGADRTLVSDLFIAPIRKRYDFTIQIPVKRGNEIRYFLIMGLNAATLQELLARQNFPSHWLATIVDRNGVVVARSRDPQRYVGRTVSERARTRLASTAEGIYNSPAALDGSPVRVFFSTVPNANWKVMLSIPAAEIRKVPLQAAAFLAAIMAILLVFAVLAGRWFGKRALRPIEYLGRCAEDLGHGREVSYSPQGLLEIDSVAERMAEASKQIRRSKTDMEQRVAEAIVATERAQSALLKSQKLEALGRLTGGISHEFNNLLQTLTTALQLAEMTSNQPRVQSLIDTCKRTVGRATRLTSQLGSFGRIQEARLVTARTSEQIASAMQLIKGAVSKDIGVKVMCEEQVWAITVDPLQFDLALLNIAINARDAMPAGGTLEIEACNLTLTAAAGKPLNGDYVRITMTDSGNGMPPEVLAKALDPFFTTKTLGHGTGLGLPQAYAFANQSQGLLQLSSTVGKGTSVELYLPRSTTPLSEALAPAEPTTAPVRGEGRVLFVEDDALVREAVVRALEEAGFCVLVAETGDAAAAMLAAGTVVDVVFSDIVMPGQTSGIDLAGIIRQRHPGVPVVLATGYTDQRAEIPGVQILPKPYEIDQVIALLSDIRIRT